MRLFKNKKLDALRQELSDTRRELATVHNEVVDLSNIERLSELFGVPSSDAGMPVTSDTAMRVSAVYACVRLIAGAIGSLPLQIFQKTEEGREAYSKHPLYQTLHVQPNPMLSSVVYWETVLTHILLSGNHYSLIGRNRNGDPLDLTPIKPSRVEANERSGRLIYTIAFDDGTYAAYDQDDILHIPGVGWDGKKAMSPIAYAGQNSVGAALAADKYAAKFFANDATPRGYLKFDKQLKADQAELIRDYWHRKHKGIDNSHLPAIITEGGEFKEISMSAEDAQLLETRRFQVTDIARIFGVPPHMIGETDKSTSWGSGIEQQAIGFVQFTLRPHLSRIEQEINRKLFTRTDGFYAEFNVSGLLRGDVKGRNESYQIALGGNQQPGWMVVNEIRKLENLAPIVGGDTLYVPMTGESNEQETNKTAGAE